MKYVSSILLVVCLGCNAPSPASPSQKAPVSFSNTSTQSAASDGSGSSSGGDETPPPPVYTQYLYALNSHFVTAFPVDSVSGDLIQAQYGTWTTSNIGALPLSGYNSLVIDASGKYLYAFSPGTTGNQGRIYQFSIPQNTTFVDQPGNNIPLTALSPAFLATPVYTTQMSLGSDAKGYVSDTNGAYPAGTVDQYSFSASTGLVSFLANQWPGVQTVSMDWSLNIQVTSGIDQYVIDSGMNRVDHYRNGILVQGFHPLNGLPSVIALH